MERLYESVKPSKGIDYRYLGFGKFLRYMGPKSDPKRNNQKNVLELLNYLDRQEESDLKLYEEDRQKLVKSLSEANQGAYKEKRTAELQTRLRQVLQEIVPLEKESYEEYLRLKKTFTKQRMKQMASSISEKYNIPYDDLSKIIEEFVPIHKKG